MTEAAIIERGGRYLLVEELEAVNASATLALPEVKR